MKTRAGERDLKICQTCRFWSMDKKGFCDYDHRGVGRFWYCEHWQAAAPGQLNQAAEGDSCPSCAVRAR